MYTIAFIITCHNRKEKTINCLNSLFKYNPESNIYLVDDGSTDGTSKTIKDMYSQVNIIKGNGNLFWNRGMHLAWSHAINENKNYDYYIWLNDDVILYPYFLKELLECEEYGDKKCIVSGLIENIENKGEIIYGGYDKNKHLIQTNILPQDIKFMNGNVVIIPKYVINKIGILDFKFHHDLGDVDYGLRAIENGIKIFSTRIPIAAGHKNNICRVRKWNSNLKGRFKQLYSPLGSNPKINFYFRNKHYGLFNAIIYYIFLHLINILPDFFVELFWKDKYKNK